MANVSSPIGKDFFEVPKAHHHVSRLLIWILILIILGCGIWVYAYLTAHAPTVGTVPNPSGVLTDAERLTIMNTSSPNAIQNSSLTDAARQVLMNKKSTAKITNSSLTDAERAALMNRSGSSI